MSYEPGKQPPFIDQIIPELQGIRRSLDPDEFLYFRSFLDEDDPEKMLPLPFKAGIAVVLMADLKRLYKNSYNLYPDQLVEEWVGYYKTLSGEAKKVADSEIYYFEKFLLSERLPLRSYEIGSLDEAYYLMAKASNLINKYQKAVIQENELEVKKQFEKEQKLRDEQKNALEKKKKELLNADPGLRLRKNSYIKDNLLGYLAGYFVNHPISLMTDTLKTELEYEVRNEVINQVMSNRAEPINGLAYYVNMLDLIYTAESKDDFYDKKKEFNLIRLSHPLAALIKYSKPSEKSVLNYVGKITYGHPLLNVAPFNVSKNYTDLMLNKELNNE